MNGLSVIILSRNAANVVPCVEAVRKHEPEARIVVVDDGLDLSALNGRGRLVLDADGDGYPVTRIPGGKPFIFARNVNLGIEGSRPQIDVTCLSDKSARFVGGPYRDDVVILNDDALLETPGGFSLLQREAEAHPEYGLIASTCNNVGNPNQWRSGSFGSCGLRDESRMVCFVAVLIPRRTLESVGLLDQRFVNYGMDDDDYSLRVRNAGLKIGIHDGCYVDHGSLTSSYRGEAGAGGNYLPNMQLFIEKWGVDNWGRDRAHSPFKHLFPAEVRA